MDSPVRDPEQGADEVRGRPVEEEVHAHESAPGLNAFTVVPWAPNLIAFWRVSSNTDRA